MKITFLASENNEFTNVLHYHQDIQLYIRVGFEDLVVSDLSLLSFNLLNQGFNMIELFYCGKIYDLKLGSNTWTLQELKLCDNLLNLVRENILNK